MLKKLLLATALCLVATLAPAASQGAESATVAPSDATATLRVGSFNLRNATLPLVTGIAPWSERRDIAASQVLAQELDVLGIQETSFGPHTGVSYAAGSTQYLDFLNGLNAAGGHYRLTSRAAYNCENPKTPYKCVRRDRGASGGDRILYNTDTMEMLARGSKPYTAGGGTVRFFVWAVLRVKATGEELFVTTTHLSTSSTTRLAQWMEMIPAIDALKGSRRVIATGDFNVRKTDPVSAITLPAMKAAGYGDVLNQEYAVNPVAQPRALTSVNGWVSSFNGGRRNVADFSCAPRLDRTGHIIDYVFASSDLVVRKWEVVVFFDPRTLDVVGMLASDHNLVVATLELP